jgi:hypothetical protein
MWLLQQQYVCCVPLVYVTALKNLDNKRERVSGRSGVCVLHVIVACCLFFTTSTSVCHVNTRAHNRVLFGCLLLELNWIISLPVCCLCWWLHAR